MKRFWKEATVREVSGGWQVMLDGRGVKTVAGRPQVVASAALAEALAEEWTMQSEEVDPAAFVLRDMADHALDVVARDRAATIAGLLRYVETDTLCYRGEPGDPVLARQLEVWEPLLAKAEVHYDVHFERISGVVHRPQPAATLARLRAALEAEDSLRLAALVTLTSLAASLVIGLAALEPESDAKALWQAAELEEHFAAERWGEDAEAAARRARREAAFIAAHRFAGLAHDG
jgi:chaperone required for assembly of F1-ATPase